MDHFALPVTGLYVGSDVWQNLMVGLSSDCKDSVAFCLVKLIIRYPRFTGRTWVSLFLSRLESHIARGNLYMLRILSVAIYP